jgi:hypothetical protein
LRTAQPTSGRARNAKDAGARTNPNVRFEPLTMGSDCT